MIGIAQAQVKEANAEADADADADAEAKAVGKGPLNKAKAYDYAVFGHIQKKKKRYYILFWNTL